MSTHFPCRVILGLGQDPKEIDFRDPSPMTRAAEAAVRYQLNQFIHHHQEALMTQIEPTQYGAPRSVEAESLGRKHAGALVEITTVEGVTR